jgi:hypothetical protein
VKWVENCLQEAAFTDPAFQVERRSDVAFSVKRRPTGDVAKKFIKNTWCKLSGKTSERFKVTIVDGNDRTKTIGIDPEKQRIK